MFKNWFFYSRGERRAIIFILVILVFVSGFIAGGLWNDNKPEIEVALFML